MFSCILITEKVAHKLVENKITGFLLKDLEVRKDYPFDELNFTLPNFKWIDINGIAKKSDFGIENNLLITSQTVLEILKSEGLNHCDILKK